MVNVEKCVLGRPTVTFLGHTVDSEGICPLPNRVNTIRKFSQPHTMLDIQHLLGMINFYHKFLPPPHPRCTSPHRLPGNY